MEYLNNPTFNSHCAYFRSLPFYWSWFRRLALGGDQLLSFNFINNKNA